MGVTMTTGGKPQGVYVVSDDEKVQNGGPFKLALGPAMKVSALDLAARAALGSASVAVYVVDADYVAAHGVIGGNPLPVANLTATARSVEHPLIAIPVLVVEGSLGEEVIPQPDIYTYLKFWLPLDEATGALREDIHGTYDFTDASGATPGVPAGHIFGAAGTRVTGNHYLQNTSADLASQNGDFCIAGWGKVLATSATDVVFISRTSNPLSPYTARDFEIYIHNNAWPIGVYVRNKWLEMTNSGNFNQTLTNWFFFAAWYRVIDDTNAEIGLRINGVTKTVSVLKASNLAAVTPKFMLGRRDHATATQSTANIDNLAYWVGYIPTEAELEAIYNGGDGFTYEDFISYFTVLTPSPLNVFELTTTSTSAAWQASSIVKSGGTLTWAVYNETRHYLTSVVANQPSIDLSGYPDTKIVRITSPDGWAGLSEVQCFSLNLSAINIRALSGLTLIDCGDNELTALDITANPLLQYLFCYNNSLSVVDTSENTVIEQIDMSGNPLTEVDFSANVTVQNINVGNTGITSINLASNVELATLTMFGTSVTVLDLTGLTSLFRIFCYNNQLADLLISPTEYPKFLRCDGNKLSSSDIDTIIIRMDANGFTDGTLNYSSQTPAANPTHAALAAYNSLIGKGYTITGTAPPP